MKRREFLIKTSALSGLALPSLAKGQPSPCPPPSVGVDGSGPVATGCVNGEADWRARINGPGVVWYHDFTNADEVNNFRFIPGHGTDRADTQSTNGRYCRRITTDPAFPNGCMEIFVPAGQTPQAQWWRPMSPIVGGTTSGNGRGIGNNDPGAGILSPRPWNPSTAGAYRQLYSNAGYYGHRDYWNASPYAGWFDGDEFYFQCRLKFSASRAAAGNPGGKLFYFDTCDGNDSEIVVQPPNGNNRAFSMYASFGSMANSQLFQPQGAFTSNLNEPVTSYQPGSEIYAAPTLSCATSWCYPLEEWCTLLFRVRAGRHYPNMPTFAASAAEIQAFKSARDAMTPFYNTTEIEIWAAASNLPKGKSAYTRIWRKTNYVWTWGRGNASDPQINGWNQVKAAMFTNGVTFASAAYHRHAQFIFSKSFIPCPQDGI